MQAVAYGLNHACVQCQPLDVHEHDHVQACSIWVFMTDLAGTVAKAADLQWVSHKDLMDTIAVKETLSDAAKIGQHVSADDVQAIIAEQVAGCKVTGTPYSACTFTAPWQVCRICMAAGDSAVRGLPLQSYKGPASKAVLSE